MAVQPVDVATAFENLLAQPSFTMEIDLEGLPVIAQSVPMVDDTITMRLEKANEDRHLVIMDDSGSTLFELWFVDEEFYFDIGLGATPFDEAGALGLPEEALIELVDAPEELIGILAADQATWEVTGEAEVNGFNTIVEEASYEVSGIDESIYFNRDDATIDAMMWVEQEEHFLVQLNADIYQGEATAEDDASETGTPDAETPDADAEGTETPDMETPEMATPETGTPTDGTPSAATASQITIDVLSVGDIDQIEVPETN